MVDLVDYQQSKKNDTLVLGSQNTLAVLHAEKLVSSGTDHFLYGPENNLSSTL